LKLIIGASSGVGLKLALIAAKEGNDLILCSSNKKDLIQIKKHIKSIYEVKVYIVSLDLANLKSCEENYYKYVRKFVPNLESVYFMAGKYLNNDKDISLDKFNDITSINFTSNVFLLKELLNDLPISSFIIFASSIACLRPRGSAILYSSAKRSLEFYVTGIKHLYPKRASFIKIIRFGYIDSRMTYGKKLLFPKVSSAKAANFIFTRKKYSSFISYYPHWWSFFQIIKFIPFFIFKFFKF